MGSGSKTNKEGKAEHGPTEHYVTSAINNPGKERARKHEGKTMTVCTANKQRVRRGCGRTSVQGNESRESSNVSERDDDEA